MRQDTALTTALHGDLNLASIMDTFVGPHTALCIAIHIGFSLANIMDRHWGHHTALIIALHLSLYTVIIMDVIDCTKLPLLYPCSEAIN
jgi:hypothetical protein